MDEGGESGWDWGAHKVVRTGPQKTPGPCPPELLPLHSYRDLPPSLSIFMYWHAGDPEAPRHPPPTSPPLETLGRSLADVMQLDP